MITVKKIFILLLVSLFLLCSCNKGTENENSEVASNATEDTQINESSEESSEAVIHESDSVSDEASQDETSQDDTSQDDTSQDDTSSTTPPNPMEDAVKKGDKVHLCCFKSTVGQCEFEYLGGEYLGGAILDVDKQELVFTDSDTVFPESVVSELSKKVIGLSRHSGFVEFHIGQDCYKFSINMVNMTVGPSYSFPTDWNYSFKSEIGSFKGYDEDSPGANDMEDVDVFGYDERLTLGCSVWCGCDRYVCEVKASSVLAPQGKTSYDASHLAIDDRENIWAEGVDGYGIGESIEIKQMYLGTGHAELTLYSMCIVNGNAKSATKWQENSRVKSMKLYYEGEYLGDIELEDTIKPQYIDLSPLNIKVGNGFDAHFRFEITDVYKGSKYDDTCLTGIIIDYEGLYAH